LGKPQPPNDVRLRRILDDALPRPDWPPAYRLTTLTENDARETHALLCVVFDDEEPDFDVWWADRSGGPDFDPDMVFLARDRAGKLAGLAWCWSTGFLKDLAVAASARRQGLGKALVLHAFGVIRSRGIAFSDLKTNTLDNAAAYALYRKLGMAEAPWAG